MEADLQRIYQLDLLDLWRPGSRLTLRKLAVLVRHLPADALVWQVTGQRTLTPVENQLARLLEVQIEQESPDRPGPPYDPAKHKKAAASPRGGQPVVDLTARLAEHATRYKDRPPRRR